MLMHGRYLMRVACALALMLTSPAAAQAQTNDASPAKTVKAKKNPAASAKRVPRESSQTNPNAGQMTPGTGPALLRGVKDDNM